MRHEYEDLERIAIEAIEKHKLFFTDDVMAYLPCARSTFYHKGLDKSDAIKDAINKNRVLAKVDLRKEWRFSNNAALQIGLYKLLATEDELQRLSTHKFDSHQRELEEEEARRFADIPKIVWVKSE
jgi:uncharacterized protein involved in type VI secretion and phage assembly